MTAKPLRWECLNQRHKQQMLERKFFTFEADTKCGPSSYTAASSLVNVRQSCPKYDILVRGGIKATAPLIPDLGTKRRGFSITFLPLYPLARTPLPIE
jgi:hypothetical protein